MPRRKPFTGDEKRARLWETLSERERQDAAYQAILHLTIASLRYAAGLRVTPYRDALLEARIARRTRQLGARPVLSTEEVLDLLKIIGAGKEYSERLIDILAEVQRRWVWFNSSIRPTRGDMRATIEAGLKHAIPLRDWARSLPPGPLLFRPVPLIEAPASDDYISSRAPIEPSDELDPPPALGVVIERLTLALSGMAEQHKSEPGRLPGSKEAAQTAALLLLRFVNTHAAAATAKERCTFVFKCLRRIGIPCPNIDDHPADFGAWYEELEEMARPVPKPSSSSPEKRSSEIEDRLRDQLI